MPPISRRSVSAPSARSTATSTRSVSPASRSPPCPARVIDWCPAITCRRSRSLLKKPCSSCSGSELALGLGTEDQRAAVRSAAAKVEAVLTEETRREVDRMRERIRVASDHHRETSPWLPTLQRGVIQERVLKVRVPLLQLGRGHRARG